jgi:predicted peptidase
MNRLTLSALLLALVLTSSVMVPLAFARKPETGFLDRTVTVGGETYRYQVFVPASFDKSKKWPVVLFLHGYGERGDDGLLQTDVGLGHAIRNQRAMLPFVVVMPQCHADKPDRVWTEASMQQQALAALDASMKEFHGDPTRVYLTGLSMGGYGTWDLAVKYPHRFAAYVPICGGIRSPEDFPQLHVSLVDDPKVSDPYAETAKRVGKTPVWIFHGADDPAVPVKESRKMAAALQASGGNVKYTEYPGVGHNSWDKAYAVPGLMQWLLSQHL